MSPKRLPVVSGARVVRALEKDGFDVIGTKGSHCKLRRGPRTVIVPLHSEVRPGTLASMGGVLTSGLAASATATHWYAYGLGSDSQIWEHPGTTGATGSWTRVTP